MQKPINSAKNARPKIAGILKIKTQKVGGSLKKKTQRVGGTLYKRPVTGQK